MTSSSSAIASFVEAAPPGELQNVVAAIKSLTGEDPKTTSSLDPAFERYNEEQFTTVKLPGASESVIVSSYNALGGGRYYDAQSQSSFNFEHGSQKASDVQTHSLESNHADLIKSLLKSVPGQVQEHYPSATLGVFPTENDTKIAILIVANKYSPNNFWNGRWRSTYLYNPSSGALDVNIKVDVHYYEDGNVRLLTERPASLSLSSSASAADIVKQIAVTEKKYQEDLNRAFGTLNEGAFKGLRRQLPITRQKIEWDKISGYRLGQDIGGGRSK
ncbi:MAG: F-actin-capping protein subunit alpha [Bathelium mastoideum]|nr:MAG: F-actin-capping protein subunit alpha [Bathelium mastoideum]